MLISELEALLKELREKHGDLNITQLVQLIKYQEDVIDRLIFNNMQVDPNENCSLYINFGVYRITFPGSERSSLRQACDYFKQQISKIFPFHEW